MSDAPPTLLDDLHRYAAIIEQLIGDIGPFTPEAESASAIQVERGVIFPLLQRNPSAFDPARIGRLCELPRDADLDRIIVVDRTGHHRPVYRPLLVYAFLQAFRLSYETLPPSEFGRWEESARAWSDLLEAHLAEHSFDPDAANGASATESAWIALALHVAGKVFIRDAWIDLSADFFGQLTRSRQPSGAFLKTTPSDNPETHWYHELVLLHAAASYAVQAEDRSLAAAVKLNTEFHQSETQPDHATSQPWALFPFLWNPPTRPLADHLLHTTQTLHPAALDGISLILLADALHCLKLFT